VFPFPTTRGSLVFAFGYNRVADFGSTLSFNGFNNQSSIIPALYDANENFDIPFKVFLENTSGYTAIQKDVNQRGEVRETGLLGMWTFAGAIDIAENISAGATLNVLTGSYTYTRNYVEEDTKNLYVNTQSGLSRDSAYLRFNSFSYDNYVNSDVSGSGLTIGLMYRSDMMRVGLVTRAPISVTLREDYSDAGKSSFDDTGTWLSGKGPTTTYSYNAPNNYGVTSPWTFGGGASFYLLNMALFSADIEYTDWTEVQWTQNKDLEKENSKLQSLFRPVVSYRGGIEVEIPASDVRIRAGYSRKPSPFKNDPSTYDLQTMTLGAGILLQRDIMVDAAFASGTFKTFRNNYSTPGVLNPSRTDESVTTSRVIVSVSYRF
jgi:hypothetical protein